MKVSKWPFILIAVAALGLAGASASAQAKKSAAELEKEKALANPYPNDFGPEKLPDDYVKSLPADMKKGYDALLLRCTQCHASSRPLNSRFVEPAIGATVPPAQRDAKEGAVVAEMRKSHPEWFKEKGVWQIEASVWNRYVKRMMNKPGCGAKAGGHMTDAEAKQIYQFLVYDGEKRKLGAKADEWKAHRENLIGQLKEKKPARYEELAKDNDL